jgi:hypothetical protein
MYKSIILPALFIACSASSQGKCLLTLEALKGLKGKSWVSDDPDKKTIEKIAFYPAISGYEIKFRGSSSGQHKFYMDGEKLVNSAFPWSYGVLEGNG